MSSTLEAIKEAVRQLPDAERAELAEFLLEAIEQEDPDAWTDEFDQELQRRAAEMRNDPSVRIPLDQFLEHLRASRP